LPALSELIGGFFLAVKIVAGICLIWLGVGIGIGIGIGIGLIRRRTKDLTCKLSGTGGGIIASFLAGLFVTLAI
jgi:hypothetical protein